MGDNDHCNAQTLVDVPDQGQDLAGSLGIQCGSGLVTQQYVRIGGQRAGDGNSLLLTARKLCRVGVGLFLQTNHLQKLQRTLFCFGFGNALQLQGEADVLQTGALHEEMKALEDHGDLSPSQPQFFGRKLGQFLTAYQHGTGSGAFQKIDTANQRGFAGARQTDDTKNLTLLDFQADTVQRVKGVTVHQKGFGQLV